MVIVELSSEEKQALLDSQSVQAEAVAAAGVRAGPDGSLGEDLAELVEELNAQGQWRVALGHGPEERGASFCSRIWGTANSFTGRGSATPWGTPRARGPLPTRVAEDDRVTYYHGRMDKGIIGEGTFDYQ